MVDRLRPTVAFLGHPSRHKGWGVFEVVHRWALSRGDIRLLHLGSQDLGLPQVEFVRVDSSSALTMPTALLSHGVDAALIWPAWPETFSLVTYEAIAATCEVITHPLSGNVVVAAEKAGRGIVYQSRRELERAMVTGDLSRRLSKRVLDKPTTFFLTGLTPARLAVTS